MSEGQLKPPDKPQKKTSLSAIITWITIGLMLIVIAAWTLWAARQPNIRSMWAGD